MTNVFYRDRCRLVLTAVKSRVGSADDHRTQTTTHRHWQSGGRCRQTIQHTARAPATYYCRCHWQYATAQLLARRARRLLHGTGWC